MALLQRSVCSKRTFLIFYNQKSQENGNFRAKKPYKMVLFFKKCVSSVSAVATTPSKIKNLEKSYCTLLFFVGYDWLRISRINRI